MSRERLLRGLVESPEAAARALYGPGIRTLIKDFLQLRANVDPTIRPICFLHTMKTAGTALRAALVELAGSWPVLTDLMVDHLICLPPPLVKHAVLVAGHLPYEAVEFLPAGTALCTVVRDPVERTLSHHGHLEGFLAGRDERGVSLKQFVTGAPWRPLWENYQARQLVHRIGLADAWNTFSPVQEAVERNRSVADSEFPLQSLFDSTPLAVEPDRLLQAALARLETIEFTGVSDDLGGLVRRIANFWDRPPPTAIARVRVGDRRTPTEQVPARLLALIEEGTAVDAALYRRAQEMSNSDGP